MTQENTEVKDKAKSGFSLPNEIVYIEFILKQRGQVVKKDHVLYGGMSDDAVVKLVPRRSRTTFKYIEILTKEEQVVLEKELGMEPGGLNVYRSTDNYWDGIKVSLIKGVTKFDLSDPEQYIRFKVASSYTDLVAPSIVERKRLDKATYRFEIVNKGDRGAVVFDDYAVKKDAYKYASKIDNSPEKIKEVLYLANIKMSRDVSINWLRSRLAQLVEDDPQKLVDIVGSEDFNTRALISRGVLAGVITDTGKKYALEDGLVLAEAGDVPTLNNAIKFLNNKANEAIRARVEAKIG